jgi:hypothetical protein
VRFTRPGSPSAQQKAIRRARKEADKKLRWIEVNGEMIGLEKRKKKNSPRSSAEETRSNTEKKEQGNV